MGSLELTRRESLRHSRWKPTSNRCRPASVNWPACFVASPAVAGLRVGQLDAGR